jgi:hypothetical protein
MAARKKTIEDALRLMQMDPEYTVSSLMAENPLVWMIEVNGFVIDARMAPREIQEIAYEKGLIPFIPADAESSSGEPDAEPDIMESPEEPRGPAA